MTAPARDVFAPVELPSHYAKAVVAILTAALAVLVTALDDSIITAVEGAHIGLAVLTAIGVYLIPNLPSGVGRYAKALVAVAGAGLQAAVPLLTDGVIDTSGWLVIALAVLGAMSVGIVPNTGYDYTPERALPE